MPDMDLDNIAGTRPTPPRFSRNEMVAELGDAVVDDSTIAELQAIAGRSGEPDQDLQGMEDALEGKAPERAAFEIDDPGIESVIESETKPERDINTPLSADDKLAVMEARFQAQLQDTQRKLDEALRQAKPVEPIAQPKPIEVPEYMQYSDEQIAAFHEVDPATAQIMQLQRQNYRLEQRQQAQEARELQRDIHHVTTRFDSVVANAKTKYADFDQHMPPQMMELARKQVVQNAANPSAASANFDDWVETYYWKAAGPAMLAKQSKQSDEVSKQREAKRQADIKAVSSVGTGGSTYQAPTPQTKKDPSDKSMRSARDGALHELRSMGFNR